MRPARIARALSLFAAGALAACAAAPESPEPVPDETPEVESVPEPPPPPWTTTFMEEAVLMANTVRIEGPPGLREHFALVQDRTHHDYEVKTTPEGLLQVTTIKSEVEFQAPIRCQLDNVTIVALQRLVVLERPAHVPVSVTAEGEAFFKRTGSGEEQRSASMRIVGRPE